MKKLDDNSVDAIVTDPPYGLKFMGKEFDNLGEGAQQREWHKAWAEEALRVLKPGGHLLAFGGTRTYHHLATAVEDAGFEIRDQMQWLYGSGFPKSLNVGKAIEAKKKTGSSSPIGQRKAAMGKKYKKTPLAGTKDYGVKGNFSDKDTGNPGLEITTKEAARWEGWGTALKPANEPIVVARKPFKGTVAENVLEHGTGAINVDGCRVGTDENRSRPPGQNSANTYDLSYRTEPSELHPSGRWPANVILDEEAGQLLDQEAKETPSRFFYCPKTSKKERNAGLEEFEEKKWVQWQTGNGASGKPSSMSKGRNTVYRNTHPTVKPVALMAYLIRLVTPPGGTVLDPFLGSGSTGCAAAREECVEKFIGIEMDAEYVKIARARIKYWKTKKTK